MGRNTTTIPYKPLGVLVKQRTGMRISKKAVQVLGDYIHEYSHTVAQRAQDIAQHAGRQTVLERDVELALKHKDQLR
jgi:histone H3/H4